MIYAIYGALGALYTLALLALGGFTGYHARRFLEKNREYERSHAEEEQGAFEEMLRYNLAAAYGMEGGDEL